MKKHIAIWCCIIAMVVGLSVAKSYALDMLDSMASAPTTAEFNCGVTPPGDMIKCAKKTIDEFPWDTWVVKETKRLQIEKMQKQTLFNLKLASSYSAAIADLETSWNKMTRPQLLKKVREAEHLAGKLTLIDDDLSTKYGKAYDSLRKLGDVLEQVIEGGN